MSHKNMADLIEVSGDIAVEIMKSAIFKLLIQIDRSVNLTDNQTCRAIAFWIKVELKTIAKLSQGNNNMQKNLKLLKKFLNCE